MLDRKDSDVSIVDTTSNILPKKLGREDVLASLPKLGYQTVVSDKAEAADAKDLLPLYYTFEQIVLFPPVTDNPNNSKNQLRGIQDIVTRVLDVYPNLLTDKNLLLFPLCEEWNPWLKSSPRQQWVLLVYVYAEKKFYLLDPTGPNRASLYTSNFAHIKDALGKTFFSNLGNTDLTPSYLNLQSAFDSDSGGHWMLYLIHRLTNGATISQLQNLSNQKPVLPLGQVKIELEKKFADVSESSTPVPEEVTPTPFSSIDTSIDIKKLESEFTPQNPKQDFVGSNLESADTGRPLLVRSLVSVGPNHVNFNRTRSISTRPLSNPSFTLKLYSFLIFAGAAAALLALLCLASTPPLLSATVATRVFVAGAVMFVGGVLGKCGLFGGASSQPSGDRVPVDPIHHLRSPL